MFKNRPPADKFFARVRTLDLACPRCDRVAVCDSRTGATTWNPRTGRWRCPTCGLRLALGVIAYPLDNGRSPAEIPPDWQPSYRDAMALRQQYTGVLSKRPIGVKAARNVVLREGCRCEPLRGGGLFVHPGCPVHGHGTAGEDT